MQIRRVTVNNFRGIRQADWLLPGRRLLCLVGPGDSTKTTLLDAITLTLGPHSNIIFSDADFYECDTTQPISIRVVVSDLTTELFDADKGFGEYLSGINESGNLDHDPVEGSQACVIVQLTVDTDLEPLWEVVRPGEWDPASGCRSPNDGCSGYFGWTNGSMATCVGDGARHWIG